MKAAGLVLLLALVAGTPALAAEPVSRTFAARADRVMAVTEVVLKHLGWSIDKIDRPIGFITTDSRGVDFEDYGVYAKGTRHRLRLYIKAAAEQSTTVTVERMLFRRERILFINQDAPLTPMDQNVEREVLDAIERAL